jgi:hypothetical protein
MTQEKQPPLVFVSYSHDCPAHRRWVADLASQLVTNGVDVILDQWNLAPGTDIPRFMEDGVRRADRVLAVCTEAYVRKANERHGGVGYESMIVTAELIRDLGSTRFIPLIRQRSGRAELPAALATRLYIDFSDEAVYKASFDKLLRELHGVPAIMKPPLGKNPYGQEAMVSSVSAALPGGQHRAIRIPATNMRIPREHTDVDRDTFLEDAFELMGRSFEEWLAELQTANSHVRTRFKRIDARQFSAAVYRHGDAVSRCRIRLNLGGRGLGAGITYSSDDSDFSNSFHESLSAESNTVSLFLRPLGLAHQAIGDNDGQLTPEQAADLYWSILIGPLRPRSEY